jgi:hypothetical protein
MTFARRLVLCFSVLALLGLYNTGTASASHLVPRVADTMLNTLVNNYRQTISPAACAASGRVSGSHAPPFALASCLPPAFLPGTQAALGPMSDSRILLTAVQDDPASAVDEGNINIDVKMTGVICLVAGPGCPGFGAPYLPVAGPAPDVALRFRMRLNDHLNCSPPGCGPPFPSAGTTSDFDFRVPVDCTPAAPAATCALLTSVDAVAGSVAAIAGGSEQNAQIFRMRVADSGANGVQGDADDREFAQQGLVVH